MRKIKAAGDFREGKEPDLFLYFLLEIWGRMCYTDKER